MNKSFLLVISIFVVFTSKAQHTSLYNFIANDGIKTLGSCAHPSNDILIRSSSILEDDNYVYLNIVYNETLFGKHEQTNLTLKKGFSNLAITDIIVTKDYSLTSAFYFTGIAKNIALNLLEEMSNTEDVKKALEQKFYKSFKNFTGKEFALFVLNINYYNYLAS
jgi:hypothetical protein